MYYDSYIYIQLLYSIHKYHSLLNKHYWKIIKMSIFFDQNFDVWFIVYLKFNALIPIYYNTTTRETMNDFPLSFEDLTYSFDDRRDEAQTSLPHYELKYFCQIYRPEMFQMNRFYSFLHWRFILHIHNMPRKLDY